MPLSFEIYSQGRRLTDFVVRGASAMGAESVPMPGRVSFENGLLRVEASDAEEASTAIGVSLLWDAGEVGTYVLETTRLPPRRKPYVLNVELARHRLMRLLHKQEDWGMWGDNGVAAGGAGGPLRSGDPGTIDKIRRAQQVFADALGALQSPAEAAVLADQSLSLAIEASEELSQQCAEISLARRRAAGAMRVLFGVRADIAVRNAKYRGTLARFFDYTIVPIPWRQLQPEEDTFETDAADSTIEFLARNRVPTIAGPLVDLSEGEVPEWLFIYEHDFESLRDLAFEYVRTVVTRYRRVVKLWNVVGGLHASSAFGLSFEQMIELTRLLVSQVKTVNPQAKTLVTIRVPFGDYLADATGGQAGVPPLLYAEMVAQSGVDCDGFGLELKMGMPRRGLYCRDLFQISCMLDRFATLGKPVFLTGLACPDRERGPGGVDPADAGRWRGAWSRERQARWLRAVYRIALGKPFIENVAWSDVSDFDAGRTSVPGSGLLDDMLRPKPAFEALQDIRRAFRPPGAPQQASGAATPVAAAPPGAGPPPAGIQPGALPQPQATPPQTPGQRSA